MSDDERFYIDTKQRLFDLIDRSRVAPTGDSILEECLNILDVLLEKNTKYGNSALEPIRIFSNSDTTEQLNVRIDDKLSRIKNGDTSEDVTIDLIGYLILLRIKQRYK